MAKLRILKTIDAYIAARNIPVNIGSTYKRKTGRVVLGVADCAGRITEVHMPLNEATYQDLWQADGRVAAVTDQLFAGRIHRALDQLLIRGGRNQSDPQDEPFTLPAYLQNDDRT